MTNQVKKNIRFIVAACLLSALFTGCNKVYEHHSDSYVLSYSDCNGIELRPSIYYGIGYEIRSIQIKGTSTNYVTFLDSGEKKKRFDELARRNHDTGYNRSVRLISNIPDILSPYPNSISYLVISDKDFDEDHPAGTPLNDVIMMEFHSYGKYVRSGYKDDENKTYSYSKLLFQLTKEESFLMEYDYGNISFIRKPMKDDIHKITVTIECDDGRTFTASSEFDFSTMQAVD